jgi:uncharacterized protein (DUF1778 family)
MEEVMITVKNPDKVKKHFIRLRVTEEEHDMFVKRAEEMGYKTVSDFIRTLIYEDMKIKEDDQQTG